MIKLGQHTEWTKSSYSTGNGACVEVKSVRPEAVAVSDSKFAGDLRPVFAVSPAAFTALIESVRV
jgi:Domain of unknown function (DUF397)